LKLFSKKDTYDVDKEINKANWEIRSAYGLLIFVIILGFISFIIGNSYGFDPLEMIGYTLLGIIGCIGTIWYAYSVKKAAGLVIRYDENGIFYWDANKDIEIERVEFNNISAVIWDPSNWTTYVSILEKKEDNKIKWHTFIKESMFDQNKIKEVLSNKVEFHNRKLSQKEIDDLLKTE
jgi:hypothetical protein